MQTLNTAAEIIPPNPWSDPNNIEEIAIANDNGTSNLSLFKSTPLNKSSSYIGEIIIVENKVPTPINELAGINGVDKTARNESNPGILSIANIDKYNMP